MKDSDIVEYLRNLAQDCVKEKRYDDAVLLYRKLVAMCPGEESLRMALAWAYLDGGMCIEAVDCLEHLLAMELERNIFTGFAFDELVRILKEERQYDRLVEICERVVAEHPDDMGLLGDMGDAYLQAGKAVRAIEVFKKMTKMEPDASTAFCQLGNALIAKGDLDGAEEVYEKAVEIDPSEAGTFFSRLAGVYAEAGHDERAERAYRKSLECRNDEPAYHLCLGDVLVRLGRLKDAELAYEKAVELNRRDAGAFYNRFGNVLAKAGHHSQAKEIYKKAMAADPENPFYPLRLAQSYSALELTDQSKKT